MAQKTNGDTTQPPPPDYQGDGAQTPWSSTSLKGQQKKDAEMDALEAIYFHLMEMRRVVDNLVEESKQEKIRRKMEVVPVRVSDLMKGFQAAVARANRSTSAGEGEGQDIETMSVKNLEISLSAPIIEGGHADDPVLMLPNIKSVDSESAKISMKFSIVSIPMKTRR
jgi:hypothetical protein